MSLAVQLAAARRLRAARAEMDARRVADAALRAKGADGEKGEKGDTGPAPGHEWQGSKLRFEKPGGGWGEYVELRGPKGARGDRGPGGMGGMGGAQSAAAAVALRLVTTAPLPVFAGAVQLPSVPVGEVVWNMAVVYLDLTPADLDASGALRADRNYLIEEHIVRTTDSSVIFTHAPPADGCHAVVTYLSAAP